MENGFFKTSISGFDKKAVLTYIDDLNEQYAIMEKGLTHKNTILIEENCALQEKIPHLEDTIANLKHELQKQADNQSIIATSIVNTESSAELLNKQNEIEQLKILVAEKNRELEIQSEQRRQLEYRLEQLDAKGKRYDDITAKIGDVILEAKQTGEQIISRAKIDAESIKADAEHTVELIVKQMDSIKYDLEKAKQSSTEFRDCCISKISNIEDLIFEMQQVVCVTQDNEYIVEPEKDCLESYAPNDYEEKNFFSHSRQ